MAFSLLVVVVNDRFLSRLRMNDEQDFLVLMNDIYYTLSLIRAFCTVLSYLLLVTFFS